MDENKNLFEMAAEFYTSGGGNYHELLDAIEKSIKDSDQCLSNDDVSQFVGVVSAALKTSGKFNNETDFAIAMGCACVRIGYMIGIDKA